MHSCRRHVLSLWMLHDPISLLSSIVQAAADKAILRVNEKAAVAAILKQAKKQKARSDDRAARKRSAETIADKKRGG